MVDASHADTDEENIAIAVPYIKRCRAAGVATEVELGRLEGGEAGLREITGAMLTDPANAEEFMKAYVAAWPKRSATNHYWLWMQDWCGYTCAFIRKPSWELQIYRGTQI